MNFWVEFKVSYAFVSSHVKKIVCNHCSHEAEWIFELNLKYPMHLSHLMSKNSFLTVISDLSDPSLSFGSTVSFFNVSSWSLIEYVFSGIYLTSLLDLFDFPLSSGSLSDVSLFLSLEYFSFSEFSLCSGWFFHYINVFSFSKNKGNILNNLDQSMSPTPLKIFGPERKRCY